ncbi:ATP-binding cassette domain-containing protein [Candidatus Rariloculus sp.]|uniref:ATP-binding cassette domain-containing protein n=1 Tax=Candidatus Rariloculus sp. TaxID=3101265 RepID=UPI003D136767
MIPLVRFDAVSLAYGDQNILLAADLAIEPGERVCLIGRNGAGKSSTLKLISGEVEPDEGKVERPARLRLSVLEQTLAEVSDQSVRDFVAAGLSEQLERIANYEAFSARSSGDKAVLRELESLEREIVASGGWSVDSQVESISSQLELPSGKKMNELSGGWRRRVALARALVSNPELLLLDEPTNHLDLSTIEWLEGQIIRYPGAVLFVTHDRSLVERVATRIIDIDRGRIRSWPGGYRDYLRRKAKSEVDEDRENKEFDKKLAEEETWIRRGIKAREHRNEGRVRALHGMREQRAQRVARARTARIHINESAELSGRKVVEVHHVTHGFGGKPLVNDFSLRVMRGDRIGIIGNNGVGKSTLLKLLLGELEPDSGTIKLGTNLEMAYFDQLRRELDTTKTVAELIGEGRDYISIYGRKKHVVAYLTDFLFTAKRARTRISALSGGERNRVILAKLFTRSANLLVLDEPTNDLDVETLEALESRLREYGATLMVVSHDRHFLDAVCTSTLVFEAGGVIKKYAGGYSDWARQHRALAMGDSAEPRKPNAERQRRRGKAAAPPGKLPYKLKRELDVLPERIAKLERRIAVLQTAVNAPEFYKRSHDEVEAELSKLATAEQALEAAVDRWAELEQQG